MLTNQFLIITDSEVQVHLLHPDTARALANGLDIAAKRDAGRDEPTARLSVYLSTFKAPVLYCFAVTEVGMAGLAEAYEGLHQDRVRFIAAALALGVPYSQADEDNPTDGGTRVDPHPLPKIPPLPSGIPLGHLL